MSTSNAPTASPSNVVDHGAELTCVVNQGLLVSLNLARESTQTAAIRTF